MIEGEISILVSEAKPGQIEKLITTLTDIGYEVFFKKEANITYVIRYTYDQDEKSDYGANRFMVVTAEEEEEILCKRQNN